MPTLRARLLPVAFAIALAACAPAYRVRVSNPGFTGVRNTQMEGNVLASGSLLGGGDMELNLERIDSLRTPPRFAVRIRLQSDGPEIDAREPLTLVLDGDSVALPRDTLARLTPRYDQVRVDEARYRVAHGELRRLAAATDVRLRLRVGPWVQERRLYPRNLENVRRFLTEHLPADSTAVAPGPTARPIR